MNYSGTFFPSGSPEDAYHSAFGAAATPAIPTFEVVDARLLFSGDYQRIGSDLIISDQLSRVVVPDYFKAHGHTRPLLVSPEGAPLPADFVDALTGYTAYAQAGAQSAAGKVVGHVIKMTGSASIVRNGVTIVANVGDVVYQGDVVQTGSNSTIGLVLDDGSAFNLSANARFLLADLTFDPNSTSNSAFLTLVQGAASFVAGQVAKTGDMRVSTPVASIGIRGTAVNLEISSNDGTVSISVIDQRDGALHAVEVFNNAGVLIGTVTSNGASLTLTPTATFDVIARQIDKTADQVAQEFNAFQQVLSTYDAAKQIFPNLPQHTDNSDHQNNDANPKEVTRFASSAPLNPPGTEYHPPSAQNQIKSTETPPTISVTINPPAATGTPAPASTSTPLDALGETPILVKLTSLPFVVTPGHLTAITSAPGDHTGPVMSASGDVVYDPDGAIYFYDRAANTTTTIASPGGGWSYGSPTISSDGRYILYQGSNGNGSYIFVYGTDPADSTHYHVQTQLAPGDAPAIDGDGSTILAHNIDGSIAIYGLQGNLKGTITPAAVGSSGALWSPCISADGHVIVFWNSDSPAAGGAGHLLSFDLSTGHFTHIGDTFLGAGTTPPTVSADGHLIAYQSTDAAGHSEIYLYDLNVGAVVFQTAGASSSYSPVLSPDGHFIVFTSDAALTDDDDNAVADVYIVDVTTPAAPAYRLVSEGGGLSSAGGVAISAAGQYVAFGNNSHIFLADPTSGHSAVINETANSPDILTAKGSIAVTGDYSGVKITTADQFGLATPYFKADIDQLGNIRWAFTEPKNDFAFLNYGQDATQKFVITLSADDGTVTIPIFVTVHNGIQPVINVADFAPVANPVTLQDGQQDVSYTITSSALLAGVVDVDGPSLSISSLSLRSGGGTLSQVDGHTWSYTPAPGFSGRVIFDYDVTDALKSAASTASLDIALPLAIVSIAPDSGASGDFITNAANLTVYGTNGNLFAGEKIQVSSDNGATWIDVAQTSATTWSFVDPFLHGSNFSYQARVIDSANITINSTSQAIVVDTTAPAAALAITAISQDSGTAGDFITSDTTLTVSGSNGALGSGEKIQLSSDGGVTWVDVVQNTATSWSYLDPATHAVSFTYQTRIIDAAGNIGTTAAQAVTIDTAAPAAALAITAISQDSGTSSDFITSDTTLTVSGSNGALGSGEKIQLSSDGGATWVDVTQSTATSWSYLDPATHASSFIYQTRIIDTAGNIGTTAAQAVTIDTTAPTITISNVGGPTNQANQTITGLVGVADAGATVTVYDGSTAIKTAIVQADGSWSAQVTLANGSNSLTAKVSDVAGNTTTSNAVVYTLSTTGPAVTEHLTSDTGASALDQITSNPALSGTGLANTTVHFTIDGTLAATTALADASGNWSFTPSGLGDGLHTIVASQTDTFGNTGSASLAFTLDTIAPSQALAITAISQDSGSSSSDFITSDTTLTVSGSNGALGSGEKIQLSSDGGATWADVTQSTATSWSYLDPATHAGSFTYQTRIVDAAGNIGTTAAQAVTIDTTAPTAALAITAISQDSGTAGDFITNDTTLTVSGSNGALSSGEKIQLSSDGGATWADVTQSTATSWSYLDPATHASSFTYQTRIIDAAGNIGTTAAQAVTIDTTAPTAALAITAIGQDSGTVGDFITNDTTLTVSGSNGALSSGEKIQLSSDGGATWADVTQSTATSWSYLDPATHASNFTYQTRIVDAAGNIGTTAAQAVTIDTTAPTITISNVGGPTNQANQTITGVVGVADAGATVTVYDGSTAIKTAIVQADGSWSAQVTLANGSNSLTAKVSDVAGNTTTSNAVVYTLSTTGPAVTEHLTSDTGASALDQITANPALSGTGLANTTVHFTIDGTPIATSVLADASGNWSFTPTGLADGPHTIVASQTDTFGNTGSASLAFTLDTIAPSQALAITAISQDSGTVGDFITSDTTLTVSGSNGVLGSGEKIQLSSDGGATWADVTQSTATSWSYLDPATHASSFTYQTRIIDAAGNIGTTAAQAVTIDTTAPTITISNVGGPTNQANQTITGTVDVADAGATVTVYDGSTAIKTAIVQGDGSWSAQVTLANGSNSLTAKVSDLAGNTTTSNAVVYTLSTTGPAVTEHLTSDTGSSALDQITANPALSGTGLANTTVHFTIDGTPIATSVLADASGNWSFTPTGLADGPHTIVASQTDTFGNTGSASLAFTLDTIAPSQALAITAISQDSGTAGDFITSDTTLTVSGSNGALSSGEKIQLSSDGGVTWLMSFRTRRRAGAISIRQRMPSASPTRPGSSMPPAISAPPPPRR
ncbi:Ig-like domain-containing protein [Bradyrhizobium guangxiense]|uniref:Ig-like domain-containing protein n=1 Tax=Bradyrhizobium guangxiense TaxID=1325115 RepID=UPI0010087053|nr:Ig-like domain-containing protein [Bradyrhizobium guangxiense]